MVNGASWCQGTCFRARGCGGGGQAEGWVAAWKDGLEQPFVKDRRSLTGADADTSATALHHLPFTGRANHGSLREGARSPSLPFSLPPCFTPSPWHRTRMQNKSVVSLSETKQPVKGVS